MPDDSLFIIQARSELKPFFSISFVIECMLNDTFHFLINIIELEFWPVDFFMHHFSPLLSEIDSDANFDTYFLKVLWLYRKVKKSFDFSL